MDFGMQAFPSANQERMSERLHVLELQRAGVLWPAQPQMATGESANSHRIRTSDGRRNAGVQHARHSHKQVSRFWGEEKIKKHASGLESASCK